MSLDGLSRKEREDLLLLLEERERRRALRPKYIPGLFAQQAAFVNDPATLKAAVCTRRAGKSSMAADYMLATACRWPDEIIPYIALTRGHAKRIIWNALYTRARRSRLEFEANKSELTFTVRGGATIMLMGAEDESEIEKLRGIRTPLVVVDECQSFRAHFKEMVEDCIEPALADLNGTLCLLGTPGPVCAGAFYEATAKPLSPYSVHRWGWQHNPHIDIRAWLEERKRLRGWTDDSPTYRREWLGEWVQDDEALVYRFSRERNLVAGVAMPQTRVCGIDLGYDDDTAFAVWGANHESGEIVCLETFKKPKMTLDAICEEWRRLDARYGFARTVADSGGLGKMVVEDLKRRFGLPIDTAQKQHKLDFIEHLNADFQAGRVKLVEGATAPYVEELVQLPWDQDKLPKRVEDPRFPNHCSDASLYAYRELMHYAIERTKQSEPPSSRIPRRLDESEMITSLEASLRKGNDEWN